MKWISVKDRLPQIEEYVLGYFESYPTTTIQLVDINLYRRRRAKKKDKYPVMLKWRDSELEYDFENVTHWIPLPSAPEKDQHFEGCSAILRIEDGIGGNWRCVDNCPMKGR